MTTFFYKIVLLYSSKVLAFTRVYDDNCGNDLSFRILSCPNDNHYFNIVFLELRYGPADHIQPIIAS